MAATIEDLYEVTKKNFVKERKQQLQKGGSLGPDDLVCLKKQERTLLTESPPRNYYHYICGLKIDSFAAFPAYLASLISRQEKGSISKKCTILQCTFYVWNSFDNQEFVAQIQANGSTVFKIYNSDQSEDKIDESKFDKIRISSALRYYRASQDLLFALYGSNPVSNSITKVFSATLLTKEEFNYIAEKHPVTDDLQAALAAALIVSLRADEIIEFLQKNLLKYPTIFDHLMRFVPIECKFATKLLPVMLDHFYKFPEDIEVASVLMQLLPDMPTQYVITNSIWCSPIAGISLAKKLISENKYSEAVNVLNATCYASGWPSLNVNHQKFECTQPKKAPERGPTLKEIKLVNSPIVGIQNEFFVTVADLYMKMEPHNFKKLIKDLLVKHPIGRKVNNQRLWPNQISYGEVDENNYLYDPGEHCEEDPIEMFEDFDFSKSFQDVIKDVEKAMEHKSKFISESEGNVSSALVLALRLKDKNMIMRCFKELSRTHEATRTDQMLLLKAFIMNVGPPIDEILEMDVCQPTLLEQNAFEFVKSITFCLIELSI